MAHPQCCTFAPILNPSYGAGQVEEFGGITTYTSGSSDSKRAILLIADVFGYSAPNLRNLADKCAAAGYFVVVPDFLHGDPFDHSGDRTFVEWVNDHPVAGIIVEAKLVIEALKCKGVSKIGCASFCWSAQAAMGLTTPDYIQALVLLHPAFISVDDVLAVKVPIEILGAENDAVTPQATIIQFEAALEANHQVDYYVKIYPGVEHGWTVRYDTNDKEAVKKAEEAHKDMLNWFAKYLASSSLSNVGGKALDFMYTPTTPGKGQAMWPTRFEDYGYGDDQILRSRVMMLEANQRGMKIMLAAIFIVCMFSLLATIIPKL
ncbi:endo-1,3;1,4-beta-D-glucanase-like [Rhododendron vialii]|uniref:endo-1,3;1,4-beta-D-glucanase-like n=1 Tax=Rhododendron vialii TaxID=182163 RepID=UPI00266015DE|nr:endo-1,3;1,4-beta-D-glucanase-like [Rhododendron vialii]